MAVWNKENIVISLVNTATGENDTGTHTVKFQPVDQAYDSGAINGTQLDSLYRYIPASDLDTENAYDIYVDGTKLKRIFGSDMLPAVGG
jgi:hypothetical protein